MQKEAMAIVNEALRKTASEMYDLIRNDPLKAVEYLQRKKEEPYETVNMVYANDGDVKQKRSKGKTVDLLLDSASSIHVATSKYGLHDITACHKKVHAADKGKSLSTECGTRKFSCKYYREDDKDCGNVTISLGETHYLPGFLHDIISLPKLLERGCTVIETTRRYISIQLPGRTHQVLKFEKDHDGLFYLKAQLVQPEEITAAAIVSDDEDSKKRKTDSNPRSLSP